LRRGATAGSASDGTDGTDGREAGVSSS
jgi:hypothetical protein